MIKIQVFETIEAYNIFTHNNTSLKSGILYYVREDNSAHLFTNNIDGNYRIFDFNSGEPIPEKRDLTDEEFSWQQKEISTGDDSIPDYATLNNPYDLPVTFKKNNYNVINYRVSEENKKIEIIFLHDGTTTITATFEGNDQFNPKSVNLIANAVRHNLTDEELGWSASSASTTEAGTLQNAPSLNNVYSLSVTYSSSNTNVATVDSNGEITVISDGTTTISAIYGGTTTSADVPQYYAKTVTFKLNVAIIPESEKAITRASNPAVMDVMYNNGFAHNANYMTLSEAAAVRTVNGIFKNNSNVITFNEFQYFTGVTSLDTESFARIPNLESLTIPKNVSYIAVWSWGDTPNITTINVVPENNYFTSEDGVLFNKDKTTLQRFPCGRTGTYTVPDTVTTLEDASFADSKLDTLKVDIKVSKHYYTFYNTNCEIIWLNQTLKDEEFGWPVSSINVNQDRTSLMLNNTHDLPVGYVSTDDTIAVYDSMDYEIYGVKDGTTTVTATFDGNEQYKPKTAVLTVNVDVQYEVIDEQLSWSSASITQSQEAGVLQNAPTLTNELNLPITYTSSNTSVATVDSNGQVTVIADGTATISAIFAGNDTYNAKTVSYELDISIIPAIRDLTDEEFGVKASEVTLTTYPKDGIIYATDYLNLINTILIEELIPDASNYDIISFMSPPEIGIVNEGITTISYTFEGNETYNPKTVSFTLNIATAKNLTDEEFGVKASEVTLTTYPKDGIIYVTDYLNLINTISINELRPDASNYDIISFMSPNEIGIMNEGITTISYTFEGNAKYKAKTVSFTLNIATAKNLKDTEFSWSASSATATQTGNFTGVQLINRRHVDVTNTSSDDNIATVAYNGKINVIANGTVTITSTFEGNAKYKAKTVSFTLTVAIPEAVKVVTRASNPAVMDVLYNNGLAANSDYMTDVEAAAVTNAQLGTIFQNNKSITSFDELQYFTGLTQISKAAFYNCTNLTSVILPPTVTILQISSFSLCYKLTTINNNNTLTNITYIDSDAFRHTGLKNINIPANTTTILSTAFMSCTKMTHINVDSNNAKYSSENGILFNKNKTNLLTYPGGITNTVYEIPNTVTTIDRRAFTYAINLTEIHIPSSVTSIDAQIFEGTNLSTVYIDSNTPPTITSNSFLSSASDRYLYVPLGSKATYEAISNYINQFTTISEIFPDNAIWNYQDNPAQMAAINANSNIQHESPYYFTEEEAQAVTDEQFAGTFSNNTEIDDMNQFSYFTGLTMLPSKIESGNTVGAFEGCTNLQSMTLPSTIRTIGNKAFYNSGIDTGLSIDTMSASDSMSMESEPGTFTLGSHAFENSYVDNLDAFLSNFSGFITTVPEYCFANINSSSLSDYLLIPNSITGIGASAFLNTTTENTEGNPWLYYLDIGTNIAEIGTNAFAGHRNLSKVVIRATTPPRTALNVFDDCNDEFKIYVPYASKNAYKSKSGWSQFADRIYTIEGDLKFEEDWPGEK